MNIKLAFALIALSIISVNSYSADNTYTTTTTSNSTVNSSSNNTSASTVDHKNQPVGGAKAPSISVSNSDVCVSGVSGGVQSNVIGLSFGTTVIDANCERLKLSRELRKGGMKVASIALLCQDPRVFQAMIMSGTPCPAKGKIGSEAAGYWNAYPELRPDFQEYVANKQILIDAGYLNKDGTLATGVKLDKATSFKPATTNWN